MDGQLGRRPSATAPKTGSRAGTYYSDYTRLVTTILIALCAVIVAMPVALVGLAIAWAVWRTVRPTALTSAAIAACGAATVVVCNRLVAWLWPWGLLAPGRLWGLLPPASAATDGTVLWASAGIELCAGPLLLLLVDGMLLLQEHTLSGGLHRQAQREERGVPTATRPSGRPRHDGERPGPYDFTVGTSVPHPPGGIRLGTEKDNPRRPFDLSMDELSLHTFLPGVTGSGKTTTLERLADGAMANGSGLVIIDCKGGSLGVTAKKLADRHGLPFVVVDPHDAATVGYEPCTGSPSDIANKLIGSFTFGENGEIYKQIAMHAVPVIVQGLIAAGMPLTLRSIAASCDLNGLRLLARKVEGDGEGAPDPDREALADELSNLIDDNDTAGKNGVLSLRHRLGAILQGEFRPLFTHTGDSLDWDAVTRTPTVVYISLPVTAASEDVELMGRVLLQDIKQLCSRRLRAVTGHPQVPLLPTLVAIDEFAALRDPKQVIDLLLQARQAVLPLVLATQQFPDDVALAKALFQAGLLIVHRLVTDDAEAMAAQFGTRNEWKVTYQTDWEQGGTEKGSIRDVQGYIVHPNILRTLAAGQAAVRSIKTNRTELVAVTPVSP